MRSVWIQTNDVIVLFESTNQIRAFEIASSNFVYESL